MPYSAGHKENTRRRIVDAAAAHFRAEGIAEAGVAAIMQSAGLTHGGFYAHFKSKDDLVRATLAEKHQSTLANWQRLAADGGGLEAVVRWYLSPRHRDTPDQGCLLARVAAEMPGLEPGVRDDFSAGFAERIDFLASLLPEGHSDQRGAATAIFSGMLGSLQLARATSPELSDQILDAGIAAALKLAGFQPPRRG